MTTTVPLIALDTETTGLRPDIHTPWEIAWRTLSHDTVRKELVVHQSYRSFVELDMTEVLSADQASLKIGKFADRYPEGVDVTVTNLNSPEFLCSALRNDCREISDYCQTMNPPHLVGAVPSFDHAMLCRPRWLGWPAYGEGLWHYHLIDVEVLAAGMCHVEPPYSSDYLTDLVGAEVDPALKHTAMGDVDWAIAMYAAVYGLKVMR